MGPPHTEFLKSIIWMHTCYHWNTCQISSIMVNGKHKLWSVSANINEKWTVYAIIMRICTTISLILTTYKPHCFQQLALQTLCFRMHAHYIFMEWCRFVRFKYSRLKEYLWFRIYSGSINSPLDMNEFHLCFHKKDMGIRPLIISRSH